MKRAEVMKRVSRVVKAAGWVIACSLPPYPHTEVVHWSDRVGPPRHTSMLGITGSKEAE